MKITGVMPGRTRFTGEAIDRVHVRISRLVDPGMPNFGVSAGNQFSESNPAKSYHTEGSGAKRKRERPRKNPVDRIEISKPDNAFRTVVAHANSESNAAKDYFPESWPKRKRGRTHKHHQVERQGMIASPRNGVTTVANTFSQPNFATGSSLSLQKLKCPVPKFYDFEQHREKCFPSEIWACYDRVDGMPRKYVRIWQKRSCRLKVGILVFDRKYQEIDWKETELPAGCGRFMTEGSEDIVDHRIFSHQMACAYCPSGGYWIYPRKGEIWALFKEWNTGRCSDSGSHKQYKYRIVEVLSDFGESTSIKVAYLEKIRGPISLWQKTENGSFLKCPNELFRFSHGIPSYQLDDTEREDIPKGSLELDPSALPTNLC